MAQYDSRAPITMFHPSPAQIRTVHPTASSFCDSPVMFQPSPSPRGRRLTDFINTAFTETWHQIRNQRKGTVIHYYADNSNVDSIHRPWQAKSKWLMPTLLLSW